MSRPIFIGRPVSPKKDGEKKTFPSLDQEGTTGLYLSAVVLHCVIFAGHVVLMVVWHLQLEKTVKVQLGAESNRLSLSITILSQVIGVGYTAILLTMTQKLAIIRYSHVKQTLTSIHDKISAWSGFGQAGITVYRQLHIAPSFLGVLPILFYLGGLATLHITTPALFSLSTVNATEVILRSVFGDVGPPGALWGVGSGIGGADFENSVPILGALYVISKSQLSGLEENTLHGTLNFTKPIELFELKDMQHSGTLALGDISLDSATFNVKCNLLPGSRQISSNATTSHQANVTWEISTPIQNMTFSPTLASVLRVAPHPDTKHMPQSVLLYGLANIFDSNNQAGTIVKLDPPVNLIDITGDDNRTMSDLLVMGCNLNVSYQVITLDGQTGIRTSDLPPQSLTSSTWGNWTPQTPDPNITDSWAKIFDIPLPSTRAFTGCRYLKSDEISPSRIRNDVCGIDDFLSVVELALNDGLGAFSKDALSLADVEYVLGKMSAVVYWAGIQDSVISDTLKNVTASVTQSQLTLNVLPLSIGTTTSLMLLILLLFIAHSPFSSRSHSGGTALGSIGLLQTLWLFKAQEKVAQVKVPTVDNLRGAGIVDVRLDELRVSSEKNEDEDPLLYQS